MSQGLEEPFVGLEGHDAQFISIPLLCDSIAFGSVLGDIFELFTLLSCTNNRPIAMIGIHRSKTSIRKLVNSLLGYCVSLVFLSGKKKVSERR